MEETLFPVNPHHITINGQTACAAHRLTPPDEKHKRGLTWLSEDLQICTLTNKFLANLYAIAIKRRLPNFEVVVVEGICERKVKDK